MKKKEYIKPEMQVINITPCSILVTSNIQQGNTNDEEPEPDEYHWVFGD